MRDAGFAATFSFKRPGCTDPKTERCPEQRRRRRVAADKKGDNEKAGSRGPKKEGTELVDQDVIHGLAHSLRVRCLALLCDKPSSPRRLADELDEGLSQVSYHVNVLLKTGLIEPAGTRPVRGSTEHFYRAVHPLVIPEGLWNQLPRPARQKIYADVLTDIDNDVTASVRAGTFDARGDFHVSWTPMHLDEQGCADLAAKADRWLEEMLEVQAESAERLAKEKGGTCTPISAALLIFESARDVGKNASERKRG
jgi:DNA-binding transcriptional ArsR family regulator